MIRKMISLILFLGISISGVSQETYTLTDDSSMTIDGTSTIHDWTVTANTMNGSVAAEGDAPKEISFEVDVENIKSERGPTMDNKMHAALKKDEHPKVAFSLTEVKNGSTLVGTLAIAGQEKTVEIPVAMESSDERLNLAGEQKITLQDYDIEPPTAMFGQIVVGDDVTVKFDLVFAKD